jgi:hypothetical protein
MRNAQLGFQLAVLRRRMDHGREVVYEVSLRRAEVG